MTRTNAQKTAEALEDATTSWGELEVAGKELQESSSATFEDVDGYTKPRGQKHAEATTVDVGGLGASAAGADVEENLSEFKFMVLLGQGADLLKADPTIEERW